MSKPDINCLGIASELTLHEKALRKAQHEIDNLRGEVARLLAENARLREELRVERANRHMLAPNQDERILCGDNLPIGWKGTPQEFAEQAMMATALSGAFNNGEQPHFNTLPPHHSTVGTGLDGEGRVQG